MTSQINFAAIDVFSCKSINVDVVLDTLSDFFDTSNLIVNSLKRGNELNVIV